MSDFYSGWTTPPNGKARYRLHLAVVVRSQNVVANTSTLAWTLTLEKDRSFEGFYAYPGAAWAASINGHNVLSGSGTKPDVPWNGWSAWPFGSGSYTVTHDADGTMTNMPVVATWTKSATNWAPGSMSVSSHMNLPTIARATQPTVTPSPATIGSDVTIGLPAAVGAYTHDLTWVSGSDSGTIATGVTGDQTWTVPDESGEWSGRTVFPITIIVATKSGATVIGTKQVLLQSRSAPTPPTVADISDPKKRFDVRARLVTYEDADGWQRRQVLPASQVSMVDSASATATCTISMSKLNAVDFQDYSIIDIDVFNGFGWLYTNHRFVLSRTQDDATDPTQTASYSGTEFIDFELARLYTQKDYNWDGATGHSKPTTPGQMLLSVIADAQARGWGPRIKVEFTASLTSLGDPWANTAVSRNFSAGTPASQMLEGLVSDGLVEYRTEYRDDGYAYLVLLNPGTGQDFSANGSIPVVNLSLAKLASAPRQATIEDKINAVTVVGDVPPKSKEGATNNVGRAVTPDDPDVFGRLEGWLQASGITDRTALSTIGDHALTDNGSATNQRTFAMNAQDTATQFMPYAVYLTGDWVLRPDTNGTLKDRIAQITIAKTIDNLTVTLATGDRILSGTASIAKRQKAQTGGAIAGGNQTSPTGLDSSIPSAPTGIEISGEGYWDAAGNPKSTFTITWAPVETSLSGSDIDIALYEVWWRPGTEDDEWKLSTATASESATIPGWDPSEAIELRVRAQSEAGIYGEFSEDQDWTTIPPNVDLDGPDLANLYTDGVGSIFAVWGGTLDGVAAPPRLAYVAAEVSADAGVTYTTMGTPIVSAGAIVINPGSYGDYTVRLRGYDKLGNAGTASDPQDISLFDPHINPPAPVAPTDLAATAGADWDANGILPTAWFDLDWTAPTVDVDGADVSIVGYDIYGLKDGETIQRYLTTSATNSVRIFVGNNESWTFQVKAVSSFGGVSDFSDPVTQVADAVPSLAGAPTAPTLDQYAGILQIKWAGGGMLPQIKSVYASISQTLGGTFVRAGMPLLGAGEVDVPGLAPGDYYAKITIVDELGNSATSPASDPITLLPITGVTIQTSALANTGIKMTTGGITAYDDAGQPTFILNAATGEVWIAPYAAVIDLGASGTVATTGAATNGIAISAENSDFNTFIHPSGVQIRRDQTALSWWEADASDASQVNFFSPRAVISQRLLVGDYEFLREAKTVGSRLVIRYKGA